MSFQVREARVEDVPLIVSWTIDTFEWGDYVGEALPDWIADPDLHVMVCELEDGTPVGVCRAQMLSATEGWLDAARVHPEHRRSGLGKAMNDAGVRWSAHHGARVVRLAVETDNESALGQVAKLGYRETSRWVFGQLEPGVTDRIPDGERLRQTHLPDLDAAWMFWSNSELAVAAHELVPVGWLWRRMRVDDLKRAIARQELYQSPAGWLTAETYEDIIDVNFMAAAPADTPQMLRTLVDLAMGTSSSLIKVKLPALARTVEALRRSGFATKEIAVLSKPV